MNNEISIRAHEATDDPETAFKSPGELCESTNLTRAQKQSAMERWAFSVRARVDAVSEGMTNQAGGAYANDVELLRQIEKATENLKASSTSGAAT